MKMKKQFGQNFLYDDFILDDIVNFASISDEDFVLEIGPGSGNLTFYLLEYCKALLAIEIDRDLISSLKNRFSDKANFTVINNDFLSMDEDVIRDEAGELATQHAYHQRFSLIIFRAVEHHVDIRHVQMSDHAHHKAKEAVAIKVIIGIHQDDGHVLDGMAVAIEESGERSRCSHTDRIPGML